MQWSKRTMYYVHRYCGLEFQTGHSKAACLCSAVSGDGTIWRLFTHLSGSWHWLSAGGLSSSPCGPIHMVSACGLVWPASKHGGWVSKLRAERERKESERCRSCISLWLRLGSCIASLLLYSTVWSHKLQVKGWEHRPHSWWEECWHHIVRRAWGWEMLGSFREIQPSIERNLHKVSPLITLALCSGSFPWPQCREPDPQQSTAVLLSS